MNGIAQMQKIVQNNYTTNDAICQVFFTILLKQHVFQRANYTVRDVWHCLRARGGDIIPPPRTPKKFQHYRHLVRLVVTSIPHLCSVRENRKRGGGFILANESGAFQSVRVSGHLSYSLFTIRY